MPEDIGAGPQPPSTELQGLTPEQNQEAVQLRQNSTQSAEEHEKSRNEYVRLDEQRAEFDNAANLVFNKFIYSPDSSVTEEEKRAAMLVYHRLFDLARQKEDERWQPQQKFYNDMSQDIHDKSKSEEHFRENEEGYKEQAVLDAQADGVEANYPPYTVSKDKEVSSDEDGLDHLRATSEEVGHHIDGLRAEVEQLQSEIAHGTLSPVELVYKKGRLENAQRELTEANERFSRLGHEIGIQETRDSGREDAILPPEGAPYKHEGKTPEQVMTELRDDQDALRAEVAQHDRDFYIDLRDSLTLRQRRQEGDFYDLLTDKISFQAEPTSKQLQEIYDSLNDAQEARFGETLQKKIEEMRYREEAAANRESGADRTTGGPEVVPPSSDSSFPSVLSPDPESDNPGAPDSPIS